MNKRRAIEKGMKIFKQENRVYFIAGFFALFFLYIIIKTFSYTVLNYGFYQKLADNQQIGKVVLPVTRGTIYSSTSNGTVFGTSVNLYDIAVDPQIVGNKTKLTEFLTDITYKQTCDGKGYKDCLSNLKRFLGKREIEDFKLQEAAIREKIGLYLGKKLNQTRVTSVFIDKELDQEQIQKIANLGITGLYPSGNFLYVNPEELLDYDSTAKTLSQIMGMNYERIKYLIRKRDLRYIPVIKKLSIGVSEEVKRYLEEERVALKKGILDQEDSIGGFMILTPEPNRYYPEKYVGSQAIGFLDKEGVGRYGIEGYFDDILRGNNGQIVSRKDILGRVIDPIGLKKSDIIGEGLKIYSTIDRNIQKNVEEILEDGVKRYRANKGTIVVMEPETGRVLAMANYPTYDLNNYSDVYEIERVKYSKYPDPKIDLLGYPVFVVDKENGEKYFYDRKEIYLRTATREELGDIALVKYKYKNDFGPLVYKNDAISSLYEPGSIMKAMTVAIGLDTGEISRWSMYNDVGELKIGDFEIKNDSDKCFGYHSFSHALNYSCNVGMVRIVQRIGKVLVHQYMNDFGFGDVTGVKLAGEVFGLIAPYERWSISQLLTTSYGLGVTVTPLQMAAAYSVLANGGVYVKPKVVDKIEFPDNKTLNYRTEVERRVLKKTTSDTVTAMLVSSIDDGVARHGGVEGYSLAGKTGTSQIPYQGGYEEGIGSTVASFAGYGPAEHPKFVVVVKLERPRTNNYGGNTSSYLFQETSRYLLDYYGIPKKNR